MASSKAFEDCVIVSTENIVNKENISKIPRKAAIGTKRPALQCVNNGVREGNKRKKVEKENEKPLRNQLIYKEEKAKKFDTDLLKIVPDSVNQTYKAKEISDVEMHRLITHHSDYFEDQLKYYKEMESNIIVKSNYMEKQPYITWEMRTVLVDWLVTVADEYKISQDALYLAVNYIDRFLCKISVVCKKFQLVGVSAMLIAGKMEEVYPPMPKEWAYLTMESFSIRQIMKMEQLISKILEFKLQPPTCYTFLKHFCIDHNLDEKTINLAMYVSELTLLEGSHYLQYKPSELAAASIFFARFNLMKTNTWPSAIEKATGYTVKHLTPIVKAQNVTLKNSSQKAQQAIQEKYKSSKFGQVALLKPRKLVLNFSMAEENEISEKVN